MGFPDVQESGDESLLMPDTTEADAARNRRVTAYLCLLNMTVVGGIAFGSSIGAAYFLKIYGAQFLPWIFMATAAATIVLERLTSRLQNHFSPNALLILFSLVFAAVLAMTSVLLAENRSIAPVLMIILPELVAFLVLAQIWNDAAHYLDMEQSKRRFPIIAAGGSLGGAIAGGAVAMLAKTTSISSLLGIWAATLCVAPLIILKLRNAEKQIKEWKPMRGEHARARAPFIRRMRGRVEAIRSHAFFGPLMIAAACCTFLTFTMEFESYEIFSRIYPTSGELAAFLGLFNGIAFLLGLAIQALIMPAVVARLGLANSALVFPCATLFSSIAMAASQGIGAAMAGSFTRRYLKGSFFAVVQDLVINALHHQERAHLRTFLKGTVSSAAAIAASAALLACQASGGFQYAATLGCIVASLYLLVAFIFRRRYIGHLLSEMARGRIERVGRRTLTHEHVKTAADAHSFGQHLDKLPDPVATLAISSLEGSLHPLLRASLRNIYTSRSRVVQHAIVGALAKEGAEESRAFLLAVIAEGDEDALESVFANARPFVSDYLAEHALAFLERKNARLQLRGRALSHLCRASAPHFAYRGYEILHRCLDTSIDSDLELAVETARYLEDRDFMREFIPHLKSEHGARFLDTWIGVMEKIENGADGRYAAIYLDIFQRGADSTRRRILGLIERIPCSDIFSGLWMSMPSLPVDQQAQVVRIGRSAGLLSRDDIAALLMREGCPSGVFLEGLRTWMTMSKPSGEDRLLESIETTLRRSLDDALLDSKKAATVAGPNALLGLVLEERAIGATEKMILWTMESCVPEENITDLHASLLSPSREHQARGLEALENIAPNNVVADVSELLEIRRDPRAAIRASSEESSARSREQEDARVFLERLIAEGDPWIAAVAVAAAVKIGNSDGLDFQIRDMSLSANTREDRRFREACSLLKKAA